MRVVTTGTGRIVTTASKFAGLEGLDTGVDEFRATKRVSRLEQADRLVDVVVGLNLSHGVSDDRQRGDGRGQFGGRRTGRRARNEARSRRFSGVVRAQDDPRQEACARAASAVYCRSGLPQRERTFLRGIPSSRRVPSPRQGPSWHPLPTQGGRSHTPRSRCTPRRRLPRGGRAAPAISALVMNVMQAFLNIRCEIRQRFGHPDAT